MSERKVLHVVADGEQWAVKLEGGDALAHFDRKADAEESARRRAKDAALGQVIVHDENGTIQHEWTYGKDPRDKEG